MIFSRGRSRGNYWPARRGEQPKTATLYCPFCGVAFSIENHTISAAGVVTPSVVEPRDEIRCGKFHEMVMLADWKA